MKKLFYVFLIALAITACGGNQTTRSVVSDSTSVDSIEVVDSNSVDTITLSID